MHYFSVTRNRLYCEDVAVEQLARRFGTPLYVYSQQTITRHFQALEAALAPLPHQICYSVKANSNAAILRLLRNLGSSFDIVSTGELARVRAAGGDPADCLFAGVAKTEEEIELALRLGIYAFNVESRPELARIDRVARRLNLVAPISVRVNPDVPARTHAKITTGTYKNKFGIAYEEVPAVYAEAARLKNLRLRGIQMHIGSQLTSTEPFAAAARKVAPLVERLARQYELEFFSIGGGLGIVYDPALKSGTKLWWRSPAGRGFITPDSYARAVVPILEPLRLRILIEPGRFLVGNAAILVTRVEYVKNTGKKTFVIVDAGMNDLIRPSLYEAYHEIVPVTPRPSARAVLTDVVGPICESGDYFCQDRMLPVVKAGEYLAIMSTGAYGFVMASNYNSRPLPAEVLVNGEDLACIRKRQSLDDLSRDEIIPQWL